MSVSSYASGNPRTYSMTSPGFHHSVQISFTLQRHSFLWLILLNFYPRDSQMYFIYTNLWCTCITYTVCELVLWSLLQNCCFLMEFTWFYVVLRFTEVTISDTVFSCHYCDILPFWLIYCSFWFSQQPMKSIKSSENARLILVVSACTEKLLHCA